LWVGCSAVIGCLATAGTKTRILVAVFFVAAVFACATLAIDFTATFGAKLLGFTLVGGETGATTFSSAAFELDFAGSCVADSLGVFACAVSVACARDFEVINGTVFVNFATCYALALGGITNFTLGTAVCVACTLDGV
jgi:hypothetical protein